MIIKAGLELLSLYYTKCIAPTFSHSSVYGKHYKTLSRNNIKLIHTNFQNTDSISTEDISSATSRCIVNKTCIYKCPQNVLPRSVLTAKDNMSLCNLITNYCKETLIFFSSVSLIQENWLQTNIIIYRRTQSARHPAAVLQKSSDFGLDRKVILNSWKL